MVFLLLFLGLVIVAYLLYWVRLEIAAFRQSIWWGLGTLCLGPVRLVYIILYWQDARKPFFGMVCCVLAAAAGIGVFILADPEDAAQFSKEYAGKRAASGHPGRDETRTLPREARDLAENDAHAATPAARPVTDPHAAQRAALARHAAELNVLYAELNAARAKLKKGSPEVAAFNVKVAAYQDRVAALAAEQAQLAMLDHPAAAAPAAPPPAAPDGDPKEAAARAALARLRAAAASADYAAFAGTLKTCLADYRGAAAFPQIAATARDTLANATPDKLAAAIQARGAAARAERDTAMGKVRAIVNQSPPAVPTLPRGATSYHYGFHPGALTPDYAHADLYSTRELWQGDYVSMDTAPGVYYRSADCEFNPQTKFFFTDRNKPKKKLADAEIAEVVRLYRLIAADEQTLAAQPQRLQDAQAAAAELLALNKQLTAGR